MVRPESGKAQGATNPTYQEGRTRVDAWRCPRNVAYDYLHSFGHAADVFACLFMVKIMKNTPILSEYFLLTCSFGKNFARLGVQQEGVDLPISINNAHIIIRFFFVDKADIDFPCKTVLIGEGRK